jgi:beta-phosphoglucomutase-like phosphatase (HAD superfamily)
VAKQRVPLHPRNPLPSFPCALLFDIEGTLVDSALPPLLCWHEVLAEVGINAHIADLHRFSGIGGKDMLEKLLGRCGPDLDDLMKR